MPRWHYKKYNWITRLGRDMRSNPTPYEELLWSVLRKRQLSGFKFLRQHPIYYRINNSWVEFFIADFYCSELKLIIEVDGKIHESTREYDEERDSKLLSKGIRVIRIKNEELKKMDSLIDFLKNITAERLGQITED
jgi:leucyl-tRNA synthetase